MLTTEVGIRSHQVKRKDCMVTGKMMKWQMFQSFSESNNTYDNESDLQGKGFCERIVGNFFYATCCLLFVALKSGGLSVFRLIMSGSLYRALLPLNKKN